MSLNIENDEAERLARELAAATGESVTRAITVAVRERLARLQHRDNAATVERANRLREIARDAAGRWAEPYRTADHGDLLYNESGLPRPRSSSTRAVTQSSAADSTTSLL